MSNKNDLFRRVGARSQTIVERLIMLWGSADLPPFINASLAEAKSGTRADLNDEMLWLLRALLAEHDKEYPLHAMVVKDFSTHALAQNENFRIVNARFPRIGEKIATTWGQATFTEYANELLNDKREGVRQGFPEEIALAIFRLTQQHDLDFPQFVLKVNDIWTLNNRY